MWRKGNRDPRLTRKVIFAISFSPKYPPNFMFSFNSRKDYSDRFRCVSILGKDRVRRLRPNQKSDWRATFSSATREASICFPPLSTNCFKWIFGRYKKDAAKNKWPTYCTFLKCKKSEWDLVRAICKISYRLRKTGCLPLHYFNHFLARTPLAFWEKRQNSNICQLVDLVLDTIYKRRNHNNNMASSFKNWVENKR